MKLTLILVPSVLSTAILGSSVATKREDEVTAKALCGAPFQYYGVSEAGAEFNNSRVPGNQGSDYAWPTAASADYFLNAGFKTIRLPFAMERLNNNAGLGGSFNTDYWATLRGAVAYVTGKGGYVVLDPHNSFRYNGRRIDNTGEFQNWWSRLAGEFRDNDRVIFEVMNSPEGVSAQQAVDLNNAAINGIRNAGARSQLIIVEGTERSTAARWVASGNGGAFNNRIRDPSNNYAIGFRQYFDNGGNGLNADCVSGSEGTERIRFATEWLSANRYKGFLVEFGSSPNNNCLSTLNAALCSMQSSNVWIGATYWAAGPLWGNNFGSIEPPNGNAFSQIVPNVLARFL